MKVVKISEISDVRLGQIAVYPQKWNKQATENVADVVNCLIFKWLNGAWDLAEVWGKLASESCAFAGPPHPDEIIELIDTTHFDYPDPEVPASPKYKIDQIVLWKDSGKQYANSILSIEMVVDDRGPAVRYRVDKDLDYIEEDWITQAVITA